MRQILTFALTALLVAGVLPAFGAEPKKIALLVGVEEYFDKDWASLQYCEDDVVEIGKQLKSMGFDTTVLTGKGATRAKVQEALTAFMAKAKKLVKTDIVLVMFSGHGTELNVSVKTDKGPVVQEVPFYCPYDANELSADARQDLRAKLEDQVAAQLNLISLNQVVSQFRDESNSLNNLLVVDACRNDPGKGKSPGIAGGDARELPRGTSILFGAKIGQKSWESADPTKPHGVLSYYLLQGLKGEAENRRGEITWLRLVSYVSEEVPVSGPGLAGAAYRLQNPNFVNNSDSNIVLGRTANQLAKTLRSKTTEMEFVLLPPGTFTMGSPENEVDRNGDETQHTVTISRPLYLGKYEVTQEEFQRVMGFNPSSFEGSKRLPVETVTWFDAVSFCNKLSELDGFEACYRIGKVEKDGDSIKSAQVDLIQGATGYRLPTEAEWEYACRAGTATPFSFGVNISPADVNYDGSDPYNGAAKGINRQKTIEVDAMKANAWGLSQMDGNVWEWCLDVYGDYASEPVSDPSGPSSGHVRVVRGGSWYDCAQYARSACRLGGDPGYRGGGLIGFRCAQVPPAQ